VKQPRTHTYTCLVIGAGFSGLGTAIKLLERGIEDIVLAERAERVGGTWRDTTYPGAAVDIPSMLYSFSFAPNPRWSRTYAPAEEIQQHLEKLAARHDLLRRTRFNTTVTGLEFDEDAGAWTAHTADGDAIRARTIVAATGPLPDSSLPAIRGLDSFTGHKIHSARWDADYDLRGKHVAVIGTGASGVQIVPELVKSAASVKVFQRTAGWVLPRPDFAVPKSVQTLFARVPATQRLSRTALYLGHEALATGLVWDSPVTTLIQRAALANLNHQVKDPWLRRQLTPDFRAGCKRMLASSDFYPALQQPNCKLITWPIATLSPTGIRTSDGVEHAVDCIVFATGYDVHLDGPPYPVKGIGGRDLKDEWDGHAQAYKSMHAHGFPNLFFTTGPNSGPGHNSLLVYLQGQIDYAVQAISTIVDRDLRYLDVRADVQQRYNMRIQRRLRRTTWMSGCRSWYLTADGHNASMYPGFATQYLAQMRNFRLADYELVAREARPAARRRSLAS
jgi:cation diffusion facilitator CzcD-associated flavoprotein CzcO